MICAQLAEADIPSVNKGRTLSEMGVSAACDIYVQDDLADRAREVLAAGPVSEEELARLSDEAGRAGLSDEVSPDLSKPLKRFVRELLAYGFEEISDASDAHGNRVLVFRREPVELRIIRDRGTWTADVAADNWPDGDRAPLPLFGGLR